MLFFFNVSDIEEDRFRVIVDEFPIFIKFDTEKKEFNYLVWTE